MKQVVKIGGTLLEDAAGRQRMAALLASLGPKNRGASLQTLVVHGGGKQLTSFLERMGIRSEFVNGLRVTSAEALDGVVKVFAGTVNHNLLAALHAAGVAAVGLSGVDGGCLKAEPQRGEHGEDLGFTGRIIGANPRVWEAQLAANLLPLMACIAVGDDGQIYNVNADQVAVACAVHWRAQSLVFLTDVDGVRDNNGKILSRITTEEIPELIRSGAVTGGMLAKLNAVKEALAGGLDEVRIVNGQQWTPEGERELGTTVLAVPVKAGKA